ncbi:E3 ubiquitin-protein ligase TRIM71-like [Mizuhopecten yessoensis]|uniref:B box-type domain-containing protein n=1 Tax=Mizuhopecten yessoensis TaxID=6573 RepID=A0A210Q4K7_MIZYE|nr:E3 ubiquitin-protein ligase TRIM71-like [Mizuhopecten yessoensis]OWF43673.1 hypothetical protein KP79_PYT16755 [Mizuhopecten yessoensis]
MAEQLVVRHFGQSTCVIHRRVTLDWFCETCRDAICAKCISTTHRGHIFVQLSEVTRKNRQWIKTFINTTEQTKVAQIQQEISTTRETLKRNLSRFEGLEVEVRKQGEEIKKELDVLMAQTISQLKHLEEENSKVLINYQTQLGKKLQQLKNQRKQCKKSLRVGTDIQVFDFVKGLKSLVTLPTKPILGNAKFYPQINPERFLRQALGTVALTPSEQSRGDSDHSGSAGPDQWHVSVNQHELLHKQESQDDMTQSSPALQTIFCHKRTASF